jgi:hypothetical protein
MVVLAKLYTDTDYDKDRKLIILDYRVNLGWIKISKNLYEGGILTLFDYYYYYYF